MPTELPAHPAHPLVNPFPTKDPRLWAAFHPSSNLTTGPINFYSSEPPKMAAFSNLKVEFYHLQYTLYWKTNWSSKNQTCFRRQTLLGFPSLLHPFGASKGSGVKMVPSMSFFATGNVSFTSDHREAATGPSWLSWVCPIWHFFTILCQKPHDFIATNWE